VAEAVASIREFLNQIRGLKVGQVVEIVGDAHTKSFALKT
jgi:hypothetical protein